MSGYLGSFQHQVDEKGRLSLPAQFRRESGEQTLVLVHVFPESLTLYPESTWQGVQEKLRDAMRGSPANRAWALRLTANAAEVVPDKPGSPGPRWWWAPSTASRSGTPTASPP
jgi:MraZ protein